MSANPYKTWDFRPCGFGESPDEATLVKELFATYLGKPDLADGTTAKFIRRGLSRAATGWPGCQDEASEEELLAVLDQGLGPTRTR